MANNRPNLLIDTNVLLLLVVGRYRPELIGRFKRIQQFEFADFEKLIKYLSRFEVLKTTPHILTEVNSFLNQLPSNEVDLCQQILREMIIEAEEVFVDSDLLSAKPEFVRLGLTDVGMLQTADGTTVVLTDDVNLLAEIYGREHAEAVSFARVQEMYT